MNIVEVKNKYYEFDKVIYEDNTTESKQEKTFAPQVKSDFNTPGHTIEISIPASDSYYIPAESYLVIKGKLVRNDNDNPHAAAANIALINNAVMYMFNSIEYKLGGVIMERLNYPGHTTSMLGYLKYPDDFNSSSGLEQCWSKDTSAHADTNEFQASAAAPAANYRPSRNDNYNNGFHQRRKLLMTADPRGTFSFIVPFSHIFGFAEYDKAIYNLQHNLLLVRGDDTLPIYRDNDADAGKIDLTDIQWKIPQVIPSPVQRTKLIEQANKKETLPIHFCGRNDDHTTVTRNVRSFDWSSTSSDGVEKPRQMFFALQTDKIRTQEQNPAIFDHCGLRSVSVRMNGTRYPSDEITINYTKNDFAKLYNMAENFKKEYYGFNELIGGTQISFLDFKKLFPIMVLDVRHQSEQLKSNVMNIRVELQFDGEVPEHTHLYGVVLSDKVFKLISDGQTPQVVRL